MKKLKKVNATAETLFAYACDCGTCSCACSCVCDIDIPTYLDYDHDYDPGGTTAKNMVKVPADAGRGCQ